MLKWVVTGGTDEGKRVHRGEGRARAPLTQLVNAKPSSSAPPLDPHTGTNTTQNQDTHTTKPSKQNPYLKQPTPDLDNNNVTVQSDKQKAAVTTIINTSKPQRTGLSHYKQSGVVTQPQIQYGSTGGDARTPWGTMETGEICVDCGSSKGSPGSPVSPVSNPKPMSECSGEADSLLDHTDSMSDDTECVSLETECVSMETEHLSMETATLGGCMNCVGSRLGANDGCTSGKEQGEGRSRCDSEQSSAKLIICHGQNSDSGIYQDHDESCYNSGTDTPCDTVTVKNTDFSLASTAAEKTPVVMVTTVSDNTDIAMSDNIKVRSSAEMQHATEMGVNLGVKNAAEKTKMDERKRSLSVDSEQFFMSNGRHELNNGVCLDSKSDRKEHKTRSGYYQSGQGASGSNYTAFSPKCRRPTHVIYSELSQTLPHITKVFCGDRGTKTTSNTLTSCDNNTSSNHASNEIISGSSPSKFCATQNIICTHSTQQHDIAMGIKKRTASDSTVRTGRGLMKVVDICEISLDFSDESPDEHDDVTKSNDVASADDSETRRFEPGETTTKSKSKTAEDSNQENLHQKRSRLVEQIDREMKLKAGAHNLFEASENKRLRDTISVELRFIDSHIKLLTEQLADLDFSVENSDSTAPQNSRVFPLIQLGFKETKCIDCASAFKNIISEHYFESGDAYTKEIEAFENMRQLTRSPIRNEGGLELLFEYYNQLFFIDKRFYSQQHRPPVYFEWHDSLSGKACMQRSVSFEKAAQLFNIAALYSHVAAHQRRDTVAELEKARDCLCKSAGALRHLLENFNNAPSVDMQQHSLTIFSHLMLCQAQECEHDKLRLRSGEAQTAAQHVTSAQHAALVYDMYRYVRQLMNFDCVREYLPENWHVLVQVKTLHYKALANCHAAQAITATHGSQAGGKGVDVQAMFEPLSPSRISVNLQAFDLDHLAASRFTLPGARQQRKYLARACLERSVRAQEEALRAHRQHSHIRRMPHYHAVNALLKETHQNCLRLHAEAEEEDDFTQLTIVPNVKGYAVESVKSVPPDFSKYKVNDIFTKLGPLGIFCARHSWTAPLRVELVKRSGQGFGFSVRGDSPVIVAEVDADSLAECAGMREGGFIVEVDSQDVKWSRHDEVVKSIRASGHRLVLSLITPLDRNYLQRRTHSSSQDTDSTDTDMSSETARPLTGTYRPNPHRHRAAVQAHTRAKPGRTVSRSLDRNFGRQVEERLSTKSSHSLTWTLKRLRGKHRQKLQVQDIMQNEFSDI